MFQEFFYQKINRIQLGKHIVMHRMNILIQYLHHIILLDNCQQLLYIFQMTELIYGINILTIQLELKFQEVH